MSLEFVKVIVECEEADDELFDLDSRSELVHALLR